MNKISFIDPKLRKEIKDIYEKVQNKIIDELRFVNPYGDIVMKVIDTLYAGGRKKPQEIINFEQKLEEARKSLVNASVKIANVQFINGSLEDIRTAAVKNLCINMKYQKINFDVITDYVLAPYAICQAKAGHYYLRAVDIKRGEAHRYRVERIHTVEVTNQTFDPMYEVNVSMKIMVPTMPIPSDAKPLIF